MYGMITSGVQHRFPLATVRIRTTLDFATTRQPIGFIRIDFETRKAQKVPELGLAGRVSVFERSAVKRWEKSVFRDKSAIRSLLVT